MEDRKIRVAITHGDTNGIGYELIFKTFAEPEMLELCTPIIYGSPKVAAYHRKALDIQANFSIINSADEAKDGRVNLLACFDEEVKVELGTPTTESGTAALKALDQAMTDYRSGLFDVLVTCPVCKDNMNGGGFQYKGLKEYIETSIGEGARGIRILLNESLRIASVTDGLPLKNVAESIKESTVTEATCKLNESMKRDFRLTNPRIALLAINPDANGNEEKEVLNPVVSRLSESGTNIYGPYATDSFFGKEMFDAFDCTLAMYDDQATIPFNTLMQEDGTVFIAGLPLVCTAPALTPCFEDAGKNICNENALRHAIYYAIDVFRHREEYDEPLANPLQKLYHEKRDESEKVRFSIPKKRDNTERNNQQNK